MTHEEWVAEAIKRFGEDAMDWAFVCPSCGHVARVRDWKEVGASENAVAFSCVGRWTENPKDIGGRPGPCNYAGGGLFRMNPVHVEREGRVHQVFAFADPEQLRD